MNEQKINTIDTLYRELVKHNQYKVIIKLPNPHYPEPPFAISIDDGSIYNSDKKQSSTTTSNAKQNN
jgi:hypothetical protein